MSAFKGCNVITVACGSKDAQTLAVTDNDQVWSWGDGDFGKLGRGGHEGCLVPKVIDALTGQHIIQVIIVIIILTKTTAAQNDVALSYRRVHGLYFLAVIFAATI